MYRLWYVWVLLLSSVENEMKLLLTAEKLNPYHPDNMISRYVWRSSRGVTPMLNVGECVAKCERAGLYDTTEYLLCNRKRVYRV